HGPRIVGTTPGRPFLFRIPATGKAPLRFSVRGLPASLRLDAATGIVAGTVERRGTYDVQVEVSGPGGTDRRTLRIVAAPRQLALTPPLGWNSWNVWGLSVSAEKVRDAARAFVETGLAGYGYQYVNIDDGWEAGRAPDGEILCNDKFPDMKALADEVHAMGLKLGIYSSPGPKTCGGYEGSYRHEFQDARTYARWGIDYLKYDWCSYGQIAKDDSLPELQRPYRLMREALDSVDRDIVYSLCQYGMGEVWRWGNRVGGDLWRTTGDITDTWGSMSSIGFSQGRIARFSGPGGWNDPDMLVVGMVGWGPNVRPNRLTPNEQITHISLWAMLAAPFLIGCDLTKLDEFTKDLLMNHEILEIQQDPLGKPPVQRALGDGTEVWTRQLWDGTTAVALFNRNFAAKEMAVSWGSIGIQGNPKVVDCWQRKDLGVVRGGLRRKVPGHGAMVFKVGTPRPAW
ncbi:MAG: putative Ig domain-containing protein, partial [Fimbriimonadales bacterium]|nr:putative Ig domain-containing protein [Fimbriimonadales bacterium]